MLARPSVVVAEATEGAGPLHVSFFRYSCAEATGLSWPFRYYAITLGEYPPLGS
jgi:hypothetical protein